MHKNIPVFIPYMGCPHRCVFCDQRTISGHTSFYVDDVRQEIEAALDTLPVDAEAEIAYFGGSFTAISPGLMYRLLDIAQEYVTGGRVRGIRFSTRPDAVPEDLLVSLKPYSITAIELGLQSMDDAVLTASRRGHTAAQAEEACRRVVAHGYALVGQMMVGLPKSTPSGEFATACRICDLGAVAARVYPTVVFDGTDLGDMLLRGEYLPLTVEDAVFRCAPILDLLEERGVSCLRVGLCESEGLHTSRVLGGAHHPALGELIRSEQYRTRMHRLLLEHPQPRGAQVQFDVAVGKCSQALGQHRCNATMLCEEFGLSRILVCENAALQNTQVLLNL